MSVGIWMAAAGGAAALAFIVWPLRPQPAGEIPAAERGLAEARELESRHAMVLAALKDLEDDHRTDKIDDADYNQMKQRLTTEAVDILERRDKLEEDRNKPLPVGPRRLEDDAT